MQIAITADVHLREKSNYPERYGALENIYSQCRELGIQHLFIAGDLFDVESQNYSDFDNLLKQFPGIHTYVIPGNHDSGISQNLFASENLTVFTEPTRIQFNRKNFLFLPYAADKSMGEAIASNKDELKAPWVLIGHGDYLGGNRETNPYEPGTYMPLNRNDIDYYQPEKVILGHIHKFFDTGKLYYTGSPCGLDINETGKRRFLVIDTENLEIYPHHVDTEHIFFNESILALPVSNEWTFLKEQLQNLIRKWELKEDEKSKAVIRITVKGYTSNLQELKKIITDQFRGFRFYKNEGPDLEEVSVAEDPELISFIEQTKETVYNLDWDEENTNTKKEDILQEALKLILN